MTVKNICCIATTQIKELLYFIEYSAYTSIVRTFILQFYLKYFVYEYGCWMLPSKYSAQAIFQHHFQWKKCALYSIKYGTHRDQTCTVSVLHAPDYLTWWLYQWKTKRLECFNEQKIIFLKGENTDKLKRIMLLVLKGLQIRVSCTAAICMTKNTQTYIEQNET
jgi:hypothetical protein